MRDIGREGLESGERAKQAHYLIEEFKNISLAEKTINKILDSYYYCCVGTVLGSKKRAKQIEKKLELYLKSKGVDKRVAATVMQMERTEIPTVYRSINKNTVNSNKSVEKKKANTQKNNEFYRELHTYLKTSLVNPPIMSSKLTLLCSEYKRNPAYISQLITAYRYKEMDKLPLKTVNEKYQLKLFKKDVQALNKFK